MIYGFRSLSGSSISACSVRRRSIPLSFVGGDFLHALDQLGQVLVAHGEAGCGGMPAVVHHQVGALVQGVGDMKFGDTAAGGRV